MATDLRFQCACGCIKGRLMDARPAIGSHCECHCLDCQSFARHLGRQDTLGPRGESSIFQTSISRLAFDEGQEHLRCIRLSPKGLVRWYADCCNSPIGNTMDQGRLNFIGLLVPPAGPEKTAVLGPVLGRVGVKSAIGKGPELKSFGAARLGLRLFVRSLKAWLRPGVTAEPFFHAGGLPAYAPKILTPEERNAARQA